MKKERSEKTGKFGICPYVTSQQLLQRKWAILIMHELQAVRRMRREHSRGSSIYGISCRTILLPGPEF